MGESTLQQGLSLIKRVRPTGDETAPWEGIEFILPVESDDLSAELMRAYPKCSTLRERKHMAAIRFLQVELHDMQSKRSAPAITGHDYYSVPDAIGLHSDDLNHHSGQESPSSASSPNDEENDNLQQANTRATPSSPPPVAPSMPSSAQQFVFSAVDGRSLQPKTKRPMTTKEKVEYKRTRERGACLSCKRQKAKCTHVNDEPLKPSRPSRTPGAGKRKLPVEFSASEEQAPKSFNPEDERGSSQHDTNASSQPPHSPPESISTTHAYRNSSTRAQLASDNSGWHQGMVDTTLQNAESRTPSSCNEDDATSPAYDSPLSVYTSTTASTTSPHTAV